VDDPVVLPTPSVVVGSAGPVSPVPSYTVGAPSPDVVVGSSPSPSPSSLSSLPSASVSGEVVKPVRPALLDDPSYLGAEAAVVYFLELDSYMQATGDTAEWEAMSQDTCEYCASRLDQAREIAERGDIFTGGEIEVTVLHTYSQDAATGIWPIDVQIIEQPTLITDADGGALLEGDGKTYDRRAEVVWLNDQWVMHGIANLPGL
jgi:hypothetical protein